MGVAQFGRLRFDRSSAASVPPGRAAIKDEPLRGGATRHRRVGAMDCSTAPLTEPDLRARIRLFGSIDHSASESWCDACGVFSSSQRVLSETSRPMNQDGG